MKIAKVMDAQGFDHPVPSASMLIPVDWQSQGSTTWNRKDSCNPIQTSMRASGPDGDRVRAQSPFNRIARPEEVAAAIVYLASPGAEWASGTIVDLNGASYLRP